MILRSLRGTPLRRNSLILTITSPRTKLPNSTLVIRRDGRFIPGRLLDARPRQRARRVQHDRLAYNLRRAHRIGRGSPTSSRIAPIARNGKGGNLFQSYPHQPREEWMP
jgi:hypothetical protein